MKPTSNLKGGGPTNPPSAREGGRVGAYPASITSPTGVNTHAFWERMWRMSGINFIILFVIAYAIYGVQPQLGASTGELAAFYGGNRTRILIAAMLSGMAILNLLWFVAAIRTTLVDAGQDGWGSAATAASAIAGGLFLMPITICAALAHTITDSGNDALAAGLNDFAWASVVSSSFPRAMLIMAVTFGLRRAGLLSKELFAVGVAAVVLVLLGGTTWLSNGFWAPDGAYSRFVSPFVGLVWIAVVSRILSTRSPATRSGW